MKNYFIPAIVLCLWTHAFAQPAVRNEPRHHNVFENDYVRVLDVFLAPNDTTQYHVHATPSVFIPFTKTSTVSQLMGQQPAKTTLFSGDLWYDSLVKPRIHRVWNDDTSWFHVMDVELVAGKPHNNEVALQDPSLQLLFDKPLVRGYKVQLTTEGSIELPSSKTGCLLVSMGDATVTLQSNSSIQHRQMKAGHYCWIEAERKYSISNNSTAAIFTLLQLK